MGRHFLLVLLFLYSFFHLLKKSFGKLVCRLAGFLVFCLIKNAVQRKHRCIEPQRRKLRVGAAAFLKNICNIFQRTARQLLLIELPHLRVAILLNRQHPAKRRRKRIIRPVTELCLAVFNKLL